MYTAAINIKFKHDGEVQKDLSYYLSITLLAICGAKMLIVPIYTIYFFKRKELGKEKRVKRCGVAYFHLNYEIRTYWALLFPVF